MKVRMDNRTLIAMINELGKYADRRLPQRISYAVTRNLARAAEEYGIYERQLKRVYGKYESLMERGADGRPVLDGSGIPAFKDAGAAERFMGEVDALLGVEIEVDVHTVPEESFNYESGEQYDALSPAEVMSLESVLCEREGGDAREVHDGQGVQRGDAAGAAAQQDAGAAGSPDEGEA